ncbi:hypothetical protein F5878DRAFT_507423, partial [Lentinula raphanica]
LQPEHQQSQTHLLQLLKPADRVVPVPIGPGLPRRDRPEVYDRYCRLMLILFKPWRTPSTLRCPSQTWSEAFDDFLQNASPNVLKILTNMQILHECKDSRDDHFAERRR